MKTTEFMVRFPGRGNDQARYSVIVVQGVSVTFIRIGSSEKPFSLIVPRVHDETFAHAPAEVLARLAIAQVIYTELFEAHPQATIDLAVHGPLWDGDLDAGQWEHGMADPAPGSAEPREHEAAPVARQHVEAKAVHTNPLTRLMNMTRRYRVNMSDMPL